MEIPPSRIGAQGCHPLATKLGLSEGQLPVHKGLSETLSFNFYPKRLLPRFIYKAMINHNSSTNASHDNTHTHPRRDTKALSATTTPLTLQEQSGSSTVNTPPRKDEAAYDEPCAPRRCLQEGYNANAPPPPTRGSEFPLEQHDDR